MSKGYSGVHNYPNARPNCWISAIAAGGLLLSPEGSSTCSCSYNYKTSFAMYHEPKQKEEWGYFYDRESYVKYKAGYTYKKMGTPFDKLIGVKSDYSHIKYLHVNLGAPGSKRDEYGSLWVGFPERGPTLKIPLTTSENPEWYRVHGDDLEMKNTTIPWVYASGVQGNVTLDAAMTQGGDESYEVVLHFIEREFDSAGKRIFDVKINGETVLSNFDIYKESKGSETAVTKTFKSIKGTSVLVELVSKKEKAFLCGVEIIQE
jgi:hypothetical protein